MSEILFFCSSFRAPLHLGLLPLITPSCTVRSALSLQPPLGTRNPLRTDIKPYLFSAPEVSRSDTDAGGRKARLYTKKEWLAARFIIEFTTFFSQDCAFIYIPLISGLEAWRAEM